VPDQPALVRDLMTVGVPTCKLDTPVVDIARFLLEQNVEAMCVLDGEGNGVGVVGSEELATAYSREDVRILTAEQVMREGMPTLQADMPLGLAVLFMRDQKTRIAYLTHNAAGIIYPAAYITYRHLLRHLAAREGQDLKDLGIYAERQSPLETFIQKRDAARNKATQTKSLK
jgi:predicted transcriptional regulator